MKLESLTKEKMKRVEALTKTFNHISKVSYEFNDLNQTSEFVFFLCRMTECQMK